MMMMMVVVVVFVYAKCELNAVAKHLYTFSIFVLVFAFSSHFLQYKWVTVLSSFAFIIFGAYYTRFFHVCMYCVWVHTWYTTNLLHFFFHSFFECVCMKFVHILWRCTGYDELLLSLNCHALSSVAIRCIAYFDAALSYCFIDDTFTLAVEIHTALYAYGCIITSHRSMRLYTSIPWFSIPLPLSQNWEHFFLFLTSLKLWFEVFAATTVVPLNHKMFIHNMWKTITKKKNQQQQSPYHDYVLHHL